MGHPVFSWFYEKVSRKADQRGTAERRQELLATASGFAVEIGAGTGLNLRWHPPTVTEVLATEPDPSMFRRLEASVGNASVPVRVAQTPAERIPLEDATADTVVCSLV